MTTKHTPAPWLICASEKEIVHLAFGTVARMNAKSTKANAKLIAAAPDLLDALIACNDAMEYMSEYDIPICLPQMVKDAIAKATQ